MIVHVWSFIYIYHSYNSFHLRYIQRSYNITLLYNIVTLIVFWQYGDISDTDNKIL